MGGWVGRQGWTSGERERGGAGCEALKQFREREKERGKEKRGTSNSDKTGKERGKNRAQSPTNVRGEGSGERAFMMSSGVSFNFFLTI